MDRNIHRVEEGQQREEGAQHSAVILSSQSAKVIDGALDCFANWRPLPMRGRVFV